MGVLLSGRRPPEKLPGMRVVRPALTPLVVSLALALGFSSRAGAQPSKTPAFVGQFSDFNSPDWRMRWGIIPDTLSCDIAEGKAPCNWGYPNLKTVDDATTPGGGPALEVTYPAPSGPPSCKCGIGGAQLYQDLKMAGQGALTQSTTVALKYHYKFPVGFDFGKNTGGKMPGLYGGEPGCESGGQRCPGAWSTRYMWRGGSQASPRGEVYWYSAGGSGFGEDLGLGSWNWKADGQWHAIEQLLDTQSGKITIWHDGAMVFQATKKFPGPVTGIFFSTFHGGHDTSWSPSKKTAAQFALFTISTDAPQIAASTPPAPDAGPADAVSGTGGTPGAGGTTGTDPGTGGSSVGGTSGSGTGGSPGESTSSGGTSGSATGGSAGSITATGGTPTASGGSSASSSSSSSSSGCSVGGHATSAPLILLFLTLVLRRRLRARR
jgi:hypothetical protein